MLLNGEGGEQVQQLSEAYVPYILEIADEVDGSAFAVALVVLRRESGFFWLCPANSSRRRSLFQQCWQGEKRC